MHYKNQRHTIFCIWLCVPVLVLSHSVMSNSFQSQGLKPARFLCPWRFFRQEYWNGLPWPPSGCLPNSGVEPSSPALQADSLPAEPLGMPKNTGVGSLSLLQEIFPTHELNQGLLLCRPILYQLNLYLCSIVNGLKVKTVLHSLTSPHAYDRLPWTWLSD